MKKILMPTDFSACSGNAFRYTCELGKVLDARVDLIHVYQISYAEIGEYAEFSIPNMSLQIEEEIEQQFQELMLEGNDVALGKPMSFQSAFVGRAIAEYAETNNYDWIVMGAKGAQSKLERTFGSTATDVMIKAACPIIIIPQSAEFKPIEEVGYATAYDPDDLEAVSQLTAFAEATQAKVHFANVKTESKEESREEVVVITRHPFPFSDFSVISDPSIEEGLDRFVKEKEIDLLALFRPKRNLWSRLFNKSNTRALALNPKVPLMILKE